MLDRFVIDYSLDRYPFPQVVQEHVGKELPLLHEHFQYPRLVRGFEQHTDLHALLYSIGPEFHTLYRRFLVEFVQPIFGEDLYVQRIPNFRFQLPGNIAVRGLHRDRDDGHQSAEINCWVPLTPMGPTSAVWIESTDGRADHTPSPAQPGQMLVFDGANLEHGNVDSAEETTRVNFDFRDVRARLLAQSDERSMYREVPFTADDYFELLPLPDPAGRL